VRSDVWDRGVPWTELILREGRLPDDLNLRLSQRLSAVLAYALTAALVAALAAAAWRPLGLGARPPLGIGAATWAAASGALLLAIVAVNRRFYAFFTRQRGLLFALRVVPLHVLYYLYSGVALVIGFARHVTSGAPAP
jgi:hypothetical protein